jgi:hypothetical protein
MSTFKLWLESDHPRERLTELALKNGWKYESTRLEDKELNPQAVKMGGSTYPTLVSPGGIKLALDTTDLFMHGSHVWNADPTEVSPNRITLVAIITPGELRGQGLATKALRDLQKMADQLNMVIVGEPVQIKTFKDKKSLTSKQLIAWYKRLGWVQRTKGNDSILEYRPKST